MKEKHAADNFIVRRTEKRDLNEVVELHQAMHEHLQGFDTEYYQLARNAHNIMYDFYYAVIGDAGKLVLVAEKENKIQGFLYAFIERRPPTMAFEKIGYIETLFVRPPYRRQGAGRQLFKYTMNWFRSHGIQSAECTTDTRNKNTIHFLMELNFEPIQYKFKIRL